MFGSGRARFVLFGSSIVQMSYSLGGWGAILADLYARKADILNRGYSSWNSRLALQFLHQIFPKDAAVQPHLIVVYFGGNDAMLPHPSGLGAHVPLHEFVENMKKIALHLKNLSDKTRIIFLTPPPVSDAKIHEIFGNKFDDQARTNEACRIYSEAIVKLCQQLDIKVVDLWSAFQQRNDWETACFTDGIHLSSEGSKIVVKEILKVLEKADWEPSLHWLCMPSEFSEDSPYYIVCPENKTTMNASDCISHWQMEWTNCYDSQSQLCS